MIFNTVDTLLNILGTAGVFLLSLLGLYISYRTYKMELPQLEINLQIINKNAYKKIHIIRNIDVPQLSHDLYLMIEITNAGKRTVSPSLICNDKGDAFTAVIKNKDFGYSLKENEKYSNIHPLNKNSIRIIKESNTIYVSDLANRKFFIPKKQFKKILKVINKYETDR